PAPPAPAPVAPPSGPVSGALFSNPTSIVPMYVTSEYGMRLHPILGYVRLHAGIDLRTGCNTALFAPRDATVLWSQWRNGFGNQVMLDYGTVGGSSLMSSSNHLTRSIVKAGQSVTRGQLIGYSGNTGLSGACHLHFEVYVNGSTVNPRPLLGR
ncbi:M23 family metallopeptidase, partial [uncultured Cellulomonas sp.]|uniref:M23 family metallopeptidase n=1 Tax=uncultured Cellulomonas sp. TaxID=189682 RepID=UPI0028EE29C7